VCGRGEWEGLVCAREAKGTTSMLRLTLRAVALVRMFQTLDLSCE
jgi:hypothetical protein